MGRHPIRTDGCVCGGDVECGEDEMAVKNQKLNYMKKTIGFCLIASPFVALFVFAAKDFGLLEVAATFGVVALFITVFAVGFHLIEED
jgi:hypothetical protein